MNYAKDFSTKKMMQDIEKKIQSYLSEEDKPVEPKGMLERKNSTNEIDGDSVVADSLANLITKASENKANRYRGMNFRAERPRSSPEEINEFLANMKEVNRIAPGFYYDKDDRNNPMDFSGSIVKEDRQTDALIDVAETALEQPIEIPTLDIAAAIEQDQVEQQDTSTLKGSQAGLMTNTSSTVETPDFESLEGPEAAFSASQQVLSSLENTIKLGEKSNVVMNAQLRLVDLGYDIGRGGKKGLAKNKYGKWVSLDNSQIRGVDSDFGSKTQKAVMAFQKDAGLPVTGDIDTTTAKALSEKESVMYRVPVGFTKNYTATQKQNFKAAEEAGVGAGLKGVELASYMAQVAHESDNFKTSEEYASGAAYEGRKDLGNTQVGDGKKYKGRAYIQLTGRDNYKKAGDALGLDLINNPALAEEPKNAAAISVWFWKTKVKPQVPDFMDTERVTKVVNGGFNGLNDRLKYFNRFTKKWSDAN